MKNSILCSISGIKNCSKAHLNNIKNISGSIISLEKISTFIYRTKKKSSSDIFLINVVSFN